MNLHVINTGYFKLDGGAMFGVVPKLIWQKSNPPDANNLCTWAMRCLLIEDGNQLILIDNGIGDKQDEKFFSHYYLHGADNLSESIIKAGFSVDEITDMFLSHLHFDHCGGGVKRSGDTFELTFKHAKYWSNVDHWKWATEPNPREKASFLKENILPIKESGHLNFINPVNNNPELRIQQQESRNQESKIQNPASPFPQFNILFVSGHTDKMMVPMIRYKGKTVCFVADLLPSVGHIPLPYVMGYDTRPLITLAEKEEFLKEAANNEYVLFFEHDPVNECCTVKHTEKGVRLDKVCRLSDL